MCCFCKDLVNKGKILLKKILSCKGLKILKNNQPRTIFKGSIPIEFAICVPVLISLIFYTNDLFILYRYHLKSEIVAQQIIQMIQRTAYESKESTLKYRLLTQEKLKNIFCAAFLTIYPGKTMFNKSVSDKTIELSFGHSPFMSIYFVKSVAENSASCIWRYTVNEPSAKNPSQIRVNGPYQGDNADSYVRWKTSASPSQILTNLKVPYIENPVSENYNTKIIVETCIARYSNKQEWKKLLNTLWASPKLVSKDSNFTFQAPQSFAPFSNTFRESDIPTQAQVQNL